MPEVVYTLSLKDQLTNKLQEADHAGKHLEGTMGKLENKIASVAEAFGVSFSLWKGIEFIKSSTQEYEKLILAQSQVEAGLKSTGYAAGLTSKDLDKSAERIRQTVDFTKAQITDLQAQLLTFPAITKDKFEQATNAVLDMSARTHHDVDELSIMLGKALQDPIKGMASMRRVGVNFSEEQVKLAKHLVDTGHAAQVQTLILNELTREYGSSAKAAFDANPLAQWNKAVEDLQDDIGGLVTQLLHDLTPTLIELTKDLKELVEWIKENGAQIWALIKALGTAYVSFKTGSVIVASYSALMEGLASSEAIATTATEGFAAAADAALGPIGLIAAAIGAASYAYFEFGNNVKTATDQMKKMASANASGEHENITSLIGDKMITAGLDKKTATGLILNNEIAKFTQQIKTKQSEVDNFYKNLSTYHKYFTADENKKSYDGKLNDLASLKAQLDAAKNYSNSPAAVGKTNKTGAAKVNTSTKETKGAKGNKAVTINIKIDALQKGDIKIMTTNIHESAGKIHDMITGALMGAVNDSQIIAEK